MKNFLYILLLALIAFGCKKDKKIEKNLWKNGGEWEIKSFEESYKSTIKEDYISIINNGGSIQFNKDGTGKFNYSNELAEYLEEVFYEEQINAEFTYHFSENSIYFIFNNIEGLGFDFEWKKDRITFGFSETKVKYDYDSMGDTIPGSKDIKTYAIQFICEKK